MDLKDFSVGQTAYCTDNHYRNALWEGKTTKESNLTEVVVVKVGYRYITVQRGAYEQKFEPLRGKSDGFLRSLDGFSYLYPSKESFREQMELNNMQKWFIDATDWTKREQYTLQQLKAVKEILDPD